MIFSIREKAQKLRFNSKFRFLFLDSYKLSFNYRGKLIFYLDYIAYPCYTPQNAYEIKIQIVVSLCTQTYSFIFVLTVFVA